MKKSIIAGFIIAVAQEKSSGRGKVPGKGICQ